REKEQPSPQNNNAAGNGSVRQAAPSPSPSSNASTVANAAPSGGIRQQDAQPSASSTAPPLPGTKTANQKQLWTPIPVPGSTGLMFGDASTVLQDSNISKFTAYIIPNLREPNAGDKAEIWSNCQSSPWTT